MNLLILKRRFIYHIILLIGFSPRYNQPQATSQDTSNLLNSEDVVQPKEIQDAPPSYSQLHDHASQS